MVLSRIEHRWVRACSFLALVFFLWPAAARAATTWTFVANENQSFTVSGTQLVRYGANSSWVQKNVSGTVPCTNAYFGSDPAPGIVKACYVATTTNDTWVHVANESQTFSVQGTQTIRYGATSTRVKESATGTAA